MDFSSVVVQEDPPEVDGELAAITGGTDGSSPKAIPAIWADVSTLFVKHCSCDTILFQLLCCLTTELFWQVMRFLANPHKPIILALSRPDPKKNITTLLRAFGECRSLRELANLVSELCSTT